jgi:hypothetical protein
MSVFHTQDSFITDPIRARLEVRGGCTGAGSVRLSCRRRRRQCQPSGMPCPAPRSTPHTSSLAPAAAAARHRQQSATILSLLARAQNATTVLRSSEDSSMLVHGLIDSIVDHMQPVLDSFSARLAALEEFVLEDKPDVLYTKEAHVLQVGGQGGGGGGREGGERGEGGVWEAGRAAGSWGVGDWGARGLTTWGAEGLGWRGSPWRPHTPSSGARANGCRVAPVRGSGALLAAARLHMPAH